jgi:hypothetical protein
MLLGSLASIISVKTSTVPSFPITLMVVYLPSLEKSWKGDKSLEIIAIPEAGSPKFQLIEAIDHRY